MCEKIRDIHDIGLWKLLHGRVAAVWLSNPPLRSWADLLYHYGTSALAAPASVGTLTPAASTPTLTALATSSLAAAALYPPSALAPSATGAGVQWRKPW